MASSPKAPASPDYVGAAQQTAAGNLEAIKYQTEANRVNQNTPWGSSSWNQGANGAWTQTETLTPELQAALNSQLAIQEGKSDQANSMLQSVKDSYNQPFNAPNRADYMSGVGQVNQNNVGQVGQFSSNADQNLNFSSNTPRLNTTYDRFSSNTPGLNTDVQAFNGTNAGQDTRNLAASGYLNGLQDLDQNAPQFDPTQAKQYQQAAYDAQMTLLRPDLDKQQQSLQNSLALQGLNPGTEANGSAQSSYSLARAAQENALAQSSYLSGAQTAQGNYASQLSGFNAGNAVRTQALQNRLGIQTGDLAARGQSNAARNTSFNQGVTGYNLNSQATQQANAARTQQLQNELSSYGANQGAMTAENAARSQQIAQQLARYQAENQASAQQFNQDLGSYGANVSGLQTNSSLNASQNQAQAQAYQQAMSNYGMDWQQAETNRNRPLNELNSLLTGQQVQAPQFNSFALQGNAGGADILGATQAQGQYDQGLYNSQAANASGTNGALAGLAGTAAMAFAMY
jgi:hypothetical protein